MSALATEQAGKRGGAGAGAGAGSPSCLKDSKVDFTAVAKGGGGKFGAGRGGAGWPKTI